MWGTQEKSSPFIKKKTAFFSGTPDFFGPSYFEAALEAKPSLLYPFFMTAAPIFPAQKNL